MLVIAAECSSEEGKNRQNGIILQLFVLFRVASARYVHNIIVSSRELETLHVAKQAGTQAFEAKLFFPSTWLPKRSGCLKSISKDFKVGQHLGIMWHHNILHSETFSRKNIILENEFFLSLLLNAKYII